MSSSLLLLQGITKDWQHADFELLKKSVHTLPAGKLETEFCIFEFECIIAHGIISPRDKYGLGFTVDFSYKCDVGAKIETVKDGFKFVSVEPLFPWNLKSTAHGKLKPKSVPSPLLESDVIVAVGDAEIGEEDEASLMKKIMFEKFKLSRIDPSNQGNVKCRFGRILTYQDAIEQFEVLVRLPILLIGVTPQDLLELTDITGLRQQVSFISAPEIRPKGSSREDSAPDRSGMDRSAPHGRGGTDTHRGASLNMRNRLTAAQAADKHENIVLPNSSAHSVSTNNHIAEMSAQKLSAPTWGAAAGTTTEKPLPGKSESSEGEIVADAIQSSNLGADVEGKVMNPFYIPSPKTAKGGPVKPVDVTVAKQVDPGAVQQMAAELEKPPEQSGIGKKLCLGAMALLFILFIAGLLGRSPLSGTGAHRMSVFPERLVGHYQGVRVFANPDKNYKGLLAPDIVICEQGGMY